MRLSRGAISDGLGIAGLILTAYGAFLWGGLALLLAFAYGYLILWGSVVITYFVWLTPPPKRAYVGVVAIAAAALLAVVGLILRPTIDNLSIYVGLLVIAVGLFLAGTDPHPRDEQ